ncbi:MAG: hypothetical protein GY862_31785 [Gammaproteobacteria bacterium]|nr:hypothetical protein [Gammaproteobacteria bacterium]
MCRKLIKALAAYCAVFFLFVALHGCAPQTTTTPIAAPVSVKKQPPLRSVKKIKAIKDTKTAPKNRAVKSRKKPKKAVKVCGLPLSGSREEMAQQHYVKGERLFGNDEISSAKAALTTAICLRPEHKQAIDLLQLLQQTYPSR